MNENTDVKIVYLNCALRNEYEQSRSVTLSFCPTTHVSSDYKFVCLGVCPFLHMLIIFLDPFPIRIPNIEDF